jgi:trimeric autotransporter adhesin
MRTKQLVTISITALAVLCFATLPLAKATSTDQVVIYGAMANLTTHLLNVSGANFGATTPTVKLDNASLTVVSFTPTTLQATLPNSLTPGSYLLTVSTGTGATFNAIFDVTAVNDSSSGSEDRGNGNSAAENVQALNSGTTGINNTAQGWFSLYTNTYGNDNTAIGFKTLYSNISGGSNTAIGGSALYSNWYGNYNTASGFDALWHNTSGSENTANGAFALDTNFTGDDNTAIGADAMYRNTTGARNTATGAWSLEENTTGNDNTAAGDHALFLSTTGDENTAIGSAALRSNTTGGFNVGIGASALYYNTTGSQNIALGVGAGNNLTTGDSNIDIGNAGVADESSTIRIGTGGNQTATYIAGISGTAVVGTNVLVDGNGQLGVLVSSARFKDHVAPMDKATEAILALRPVTFSYKEKVDPNCAPQFGLIAEDVEKVNPDLVVRDSSGKPFTVRYEAVNAMLLNEFLKAHRRIEEQDKRIDELTAQLKQQAALIQKVSDKVEMTKPAPQVVSNDR